MRQVQALGSIPTNEQVLTFTSSLAQLPDLTAMTTEERAIFHAEKRGLVPDMHAWRDQVVLRQDARDL